MTILILSLGGWVGGGGWGKIEIKDQLSAAEAETWAELGKNVLKRWKIFYTLSNRSEADSTFNPALQFKLQI